MANNTLERRIKIVDILREFGEVRVDYLSNHFKISEVTIRKDLAELETQGLLIRRFGGAVLASSQTPHHSQQNQRKQAIAACAAKSIGPGARIIIDSGLTTYALLPFIRSIPNLVVMTNSLETATALTLLDSDLTLLMPGGTWDKRSESFQGHLAEVMLKEYNFDQLFIGADGIDLNRGTTTFNEFTGLSQTMATVAKQVIVMVEANKFGRKMHNVELPWNLVDVLVTDAEVNSSDKQALEGLGIQVLVAPAIKLSAD